MAGLVARYKRFQQNQHPIPPIELAWMQSLCDKVRACVGPLPLDIKKYPEGYLPFMHTMLRDMETRNQHLIFKGKEQRPYKLFSLLPQKKLRPINIKINNTLLMDMHKCLTNGVQLEGRDLWEYYFNTKLVTRSERRSLRNSW